MFFSLFLSRKIHIKHRLFRLNIAYLTGSAYLRNAYLSGKLRTKKSCEPPLKKVEQHNVLVLAEGCNVFNFYTLFQPQLIHMPWIQTKSVLFYILLS